MVAASIPAQVDTAMHAKLTSAEVVAQFRDEALTQTTTETFNRSEP